MTFIDDITAAAEAVGIEKVGLVFGIAFTPWESDEQRDKFLGLLRGNE